MLVKVAVFSRFIYILTDFTFLECYLMRAYKICVLGIITKQLVRLSPYHIGNTSFHLNKVEQYWAWIVLKWETTWELQLLLTKTKTKLSSVARAWKPSRWPANYFISRLWESLDCVPDSLLVTVEKRSHQITGHLNWAQPRGAMKMAKSWKRSLAAIWCGSGLEGHWFKTWCSCDLYTCETYWLNVEMWHELNK